MKPLPLTRLVPMASVRPVVAGGSARNARQAAVCCLTKQDFRQLRNLFEAINISATGELSLDELSADERVAFVERAVFVSLVVVALVLVRHSDV